MLNSKLNGGGDQMKAIINTYAASVVCHTDYFFDVDKRTNGKSSQSEKKAVNSISVVLHPNSGFDRLQVYMARKTGQ